MKVRGGRDSPTTLTLPHGKGSLRRLPSTEKGSHLLSFFCLVLGFPRTRHRFASSLLILPKFKKGNTFRVFPFLNAGWTTLSLSPTFSSRRRSQVRVCLAHATRRIFSSGEARDDESRGVCGNTSRFEEERNEARRKKRQVAGWTRLELATSCVTGRRSNQTELPPLDNGKTNT